MKWNLYAHHVISILYLPIVLFKDTFGSLEVDGCCTGRFSDLKGGGVARFVTSDLATGGLSGTKGL